MRTRRVAHAVRLLGAGLLVSLAGLPASAAPPLSYQELTFTQNDEWATSTERTPDGGTIAAGVALNAVTARDIMLEKLDKCGNRQWVRHYSNPFPNGQLEAHSVRVAKDGNYVVAGEMRPSPIPGHEIFLMKVNAASGAVMWAHVYQGDGFSTDGQTVTRELAGAQGGWVLIGRRSNPPQGGIRGGVLITTNANGNQTSGCVWTDVRHGPTTYTSFNDVRQNPDGSFTVVGWSRRGDAGPVDLLALRTQTPNPCGALRWANVYLQNQPLTEQFFGEGMDLAPAYTANGQNFPAGYIFTGPWLNANNANMGSSVVRTDPNGVPMWMFTTDTFWGSQSVRARPHGGFVFAGREAQNAVGTGFNGSLMRVSNTGNISHQVRFFNTNFPNTPELAHEAIPAPDGGVFAVADARNYFGGASRDFWTSKTNSLLSTVSATPTVNVCDERIIPQQAPRDPFTPIQMVRSDEQPSQQVDVMFTPRDPFVRDICTHTCGCTPAPSRMTLWLPFDEPAGITAANIRAPAFPGTDVNGVAHTLGVQVDNSRTFDGVNDYVQVPDYAGINPGAGAFTIDAWINPADTNGVRTIVDKRTTSSGFPIPSGYAFFILNGTLWTQLANGAAFGNFNSGLAIPTNTWTHVATVYNPIPSPTLTMYVNGVAGAPIAIPAAIAGNHSSVGFPFRVGARANPIASYFNGGIDEVEFHRAALPASEIQRVFQANVSGKCKNACSAPVTPFCVPGQTTVTANLTVCNYTTSPATYSWNLSGDGVGPGCSVAGPTTFSPSTGTTPVINPGGCFTFPVVITRPVGLFGVGLTGCYTFAVQNNVTGDQFSCPGKVVDNTNLCFNIPLDPSGLIAVPAPGLSVPLTLTNTGGGGQTGTLRLRVIGPDMEPDLATISLNGLPPGQPVLRSFSLPSGASQTSSLDLLFTSPDPEQLYNLVIEADTDGDGEWEPISTYRVGDTGPCVADVDDGSFTGMPDGGVTIDDLLYYLFIFENGDLTADVDDGSATGTPDGGVTIDDLLYYLQRFELGC
jgi:hypothetical protein